ncbi:MAG: aspartate-semialdehyde dehydrogenase [Oscillospiraceae bacterium]|nr:aspartate-semialdehyde dehydrogenase [Oscillospiraceae bacterium]
MKNYTVAVLGATGAVGREMLRILQERNFPVGKLIALGSERSNGSFVSFAGEQIPVQEATKESFAGVDIVLGAADNQTALEFAPIITQNGAVFVDNSSAFRQYPNVPLVVPEINPEDVRKHEGIISNPNCTTAISLTAIAPLRALSPIRSIWAATYQAVSGAGIAGPVELQQQITALGRGEPYPPQVFPHQIAYNLIPRIGEHQELGYTSEEMKLQYEGRKILHQPELTVSCTCVRVPVMRSHSVSASICFEDHVDVAAAREILAAAPGCRLLDDLAAEEYPTPLLSSDQDLVLVGRLRQDLTDSNRLNLWCCGDQLRKGAATNAVQIAELLIK